MMRRIVEYCLKFRHSVLAGAAALALLAAYRLGDTPVDVLPEFAPPVIEVQTEALGLSAGEVENLITVNLEELLSGVPWLHRVSSESVTGLSSIRMIFERGTDIMRARQMIQERLTLAYTLPNVSKPPVMLQPVSATNRVMMVGMTSKTVPPIQQSVIALWTMKPKLLGVPGVANVAIWGERRRQLQVQVEPQKLLARGITQHQVVTSSGDSLWVSFLSFLKASVPGTGGWVDGPQQRLEIRHVLPMSTAEDLAKVNVDGTTGLRLGDIATVVEQHPLMIGDAIVGDTQGLLFVVEKFPWANTQVVTKGVEAALESLRGGLPGVELDSQIFRPATFINAAFANLNQVFLIGAGLLALAIAAFLLEWRVVLIALAAIPLSLIAAVMVLVYTGATINLMILAGLVAALGAVIDDSVTAVDNIRRRLGEQRAAGSDVSTGSIILEASLEVRRPILYATLVLLLVVAPVFALVGLPGTFLGPAAASYMLALLASMAVALTVTPALALLLLGNKPLGQHVSPLVRPLQRGYESLLGHLMAAPRGTIAVASLVVLTGLVVSPMLHRSLLPAFLERDVVINWAAGPGTSYPAMHRITSRVTHELRKLQGVRNVSAHLGRAITGDQVVAMNTGQVWVNIDPKADYHATLAAIRETVAGYPGITADVRTYLQSRVAEVLTGSVRPVVVRVYGADRTVLRSKAEEIKQAVARIDGLAELQIDDQQHEPHLQVTVDIAAAAAAGLKPGDVRRAASTVFTGLEVGKIFESQKVYEVVVWSTPQSRNSLSSLHDLAIETPSGGQVRMGDIAKVAVVPTPTVIKHDNVSNYIDVVADISGRDFNSVMRDVERRLRDVTFPLEYRAELLGEYQDVQANQRRVIAVAIGAVIGILLLLQAAFRSWRLAAALFAALPLALAGGVLAAFAFDGTVSLGSFAGLAAALVIAVRGSTLLIDRYEHLRQHEGEAFGPALVLRGARERLGPTLVALIATALAVLPIVVLGAGAGLEILRPMAIVMLGGLVGSAMLTLVVVPALYLIFGATREPELDLGGKP
jgi:CzcA family heavy metal efflux pump